METKRFLKSRDERKRVEMRFAHLKMHHGFERMRLRGLSGARDEFHLAAIVQNLKTLALRSLGPPAAPRSRLLRETSEIMKRTAAAKLSPISIPVQSGAITNEKPTFSTASVIRVDLTVSRSLPVFPDKRTFSETVSMSQTCQQATLRVGRHCYPIWSTSTGKLSALIWPFMSVQKQST
jgi:Transposase DDE domain